MQQPWSFYEKLSKENASPRTWGSAPGRRNRSSRPPDLLRFRGLHNRRECILSYVNNGKFTKKSRNQRYSQKTNQDRINAAVETQSEQIACLTNQMSDLMAVLASNPAGVKAKTARINTVSFPDDILDINKESESDIFSFL